MSVEAIDEHLEVPSLPVGTSEDKQLTLSFQVGDKGAYQAIYDRYSARVLSVCRRMLNQPEDAKEASQETFLRVYQGLARFNGRYQLGPWITRIATNVCLDQLRARQRKPSQAMPLEDFIKIEAVPQEKMAEPEEVVIRNFESRRVRKVLESLPPAHRAAIVLRDFEGLSYSEVAAVMGVTECQVKALIHRARRGFKRSWTSSVAALLPFRFIGRHTDSFEHGQGLSGTAGSLAQVATSCSAAFQQCGQYVTERAAGVVTAVLIGGVAAAGAVSAHDAGASRPAISAPTVGSMHVAASSAARIHRHHKHHGTGVAEPLPRPTAPPTTEPSPAATETPLAPPADPGTSDESDDSQTGDPGDSRPPAEPTPSESPSATPEPEPTGFTFWFDPGASAKAAACACAQPTNVQSNAVGITTNGIEYLDQVLTGSASRDGAPLYGLWIHQRSDSGTSHSIAFRLYTPDGGYFYEGTGALADRSLTSWGGWSYEYAGTFHLVSRPGGESAMPTSGTYRVTVEAAWASNRVVRTVMELH
ncbi:MAG: sigma-70 family RNA polymerase sigma factor [Actinomycetota bacterium]